MLFVEAINGGSEGALWLLADSVPSAGDLGYDAERERILLPRTHKNALTFISLRPD